MNVEGTASVVRQAIDAVGPVRVLVCCAGVGRIEPIVGPMAVPFEQLLNTIAVNLIGTLNAVTLVATDLGIRVNTISPGPFATAMIRNAPAQMLADVLRGMPFPKRMGVPDEFAALVRHICANRFLNGSVIRLDGANRMPYYSDMG